MDDVPEEAHQEMTVQMEHTPCEDPLKHEAALMSEFHISYIICAACLIIQYFSDEKFSSLENTEDPPWRMTPQTQHIKDWDPVTMMQQTEHTVYSAASHE